jgi:hypothetical protein
MEGATMLQQLSLPWRHSVRREKQCDDKSPTLRPCKWNVPIATMTFTKHQHNKPKLEIKPLLKPEHDVRALHQRVWAPSKVNSILTRIREYQTNTGNVVGWSHILPQVVASDVIISPLKELPPSIQNIKVQCDRIKTKLFLESQGSK